MPRGDVAVKMNIHANSSASCVRLEMCDPGMHWRLAAEHGYLARGARRCVMTAWLWLPHGRKDGEKEDLPPGSMPHLTLRRSQSNVCVAVYLAYHVLTADIANKV